MRVGFLQQSFRFLAGSHNSTLLPITSLRANLQGTFLDDRFFGNIRSLRRIDTGGRNPWDSEVVERCDLGLQFVDKTDTCSGVASNVHCGACVRA
jgi:hypothetical protein